MGAWYGLAPIGSERTCKRRGYRGYFPNAVIFPIMFRAFIKDRFTRDIEKLREEFNTGIVYLNHSLTNLNGERIKYLLGVYTGLAEHITAMHKLFKPRHSPRNKQEQIEMFRLAEDATEKLTQTFNVRRILLSSETVRLFTQYQIDCAVMLDAVNEAMIASPNVISDAKREELWNMVQPFLRTFLDQINDEFRKVIAAK